MKKYNDFVPPCGAFCGGCPYYLRDKNPCKGAEIRCKERKCKGIYVCCIEKKELDFCFQCKTFPCSRLKKFSNLWKNTGQDLIENQLKLKNFGIEKFLEDWNKNIT